MVRPTIAEVSVIGHEVYPSAPMRANVRDTTRPHSQLLDKLALPNKYRWFLRGNSACPKRVNYLGALTVCSRTLPHAPFPDNFCVADDLTTNARAPFCGILPVTPFTSRHAFPLSN